MQDHANLNLTLQQKMLTFHSNIRKTNLSTMQRQIRQNNKHRLNSIHLTSLKHTIVQCKSAQDIASIMQNDSLGSDLHNLIVEQKLDHLIFEVLMNNQNTIQSKNIIVKAFLKIIKNYNASSSMLLTSHQYIDFIWSQFKTIQYNKQTFQYLDGLLEVLSYLTCFQNVQFNYYLDDIKIISFLGSKLRNQFIDKQIIWSSEETTKKRISFILQIMENILCSQQPQYVKSLFPQVINQIYQSANLYRRCPCEFAAVLVAILTFNYHHKQTIVNLLTLYHIQILSDLQSLYESVDDYKEANTLTTHFLNLIPGLLNISFIPVEMIFGGGRQIVQFYLRNVQQEDKELQKAAWKNLEYILYFFRETLIMIDQSILESLCEVLAGKFIFENPHLDKCMDCLNVLVIVDYNDTTVFKKLIEKGVMERIQNYIGKLKECQTESDMVYPMIKLINVLVDNGLQCLPSLFSTRQMHRISDLLEDIIFSFKKEEYELTAEVTSKIKKGMALKSK